MRVHINLDADLIAALDSRVGARRRSAFIASAVARALEDEQRWELIESALGTIADEGHEWDDDAAGWVTRQRQSDAARVG